MYLSLAPWPRCRFGSSLALVLALGCAHAKPPPPVAEAPELTPIPEPPPVPASAMDDDPYAVLDAGIDGGSEPPPVLKGAVPMAAPLPPSGPGPSAKREALAATFQRALDGGDLHRARRDATRWLLSCGPEATDRCRQEGLDRLRAVATRAPTDRALEKKLEKLADADSCLASAEKSPAAPEPCLTPALEAYRAFGDKLMLQRALLASLRDAAIANDARAQAGYKRVVSACREPRCSATRAKALRAYANWAREKSKLELELSLRFKADRAEAESASAERRPYVRSAETDDACRRYDAETDEGHCRALERRVTKGLSFRDWSKEALAGELPKERVLEVNAQYLVTLGACFKAEGRRLQGDATETFDLRWMIGTDGHVARFEVEPALEAVHPLQRCLSEAFALWRYPRSPGENQHVEQSFTVTATER